MDNGSDTAGSASLYGRIGERLSSSGMRLRGGFYPEPGEVLLDSGQPAVTVLLVGHAGSRIWGAFAAANSGGGDPMDRWSRQVIERISEECGGHVAMPSDGPPYRPFQRWAMRAEPVFPSPLGILIHPEFGLWHGYRGAMLFAERLDFPEAAAARSPCETCPDRPCLGACPVGAFSDTGYDVGACRGHLRSGAGGDCLGGSCLARRACPVGREYRYAPEHAAFHMEAFLDG